MEEAFKVVRAICQGQTEIELDSVDEETVLENVKTVFPRLYYHWYFRDGRKILKWTALGSDQTLSAVCDQSSKAKDSGRINYGTNHTVSRLSTITYLQAKHQ